MKAKVILVVVRAFRTLRKDFMKGVELKLLKEISNKKMDKEVVDVFKMG